MELGVSKPLQWRTAEMTEDEFKDRLGIPADWPLIHVELNFVTRMVRVIASPEEEK